MEHFSDDYVRQFCSIWYDDRSLIERIRRRMAGREDASQSPATKEPNSAEATHRVER
jgi:hypothetical protein